MPSTRRPARFQILVACLAAAFALLPATALAATQGHAARVSRPRLVSALTPAQGMFGANLTVCEQDLQTMAQAGLKVVVTDFSDASEANIQAYAQSAQSVGMSVMWQINDPGFWGGTFIGGSAASDYSQFATACGCDTTSGVLDAMVSFLAGLPGTYGYYAADDQNIAPGSTAALAQYVQAIKAIDSTHMVMIGADGAQASQNASAGAVMGNEIYPETTFNIANQSRNLATWESVQQQVHPPGIHVRGQPLRRRSGWRLHAEHDARSMREPAALPE
jgi:hypothetical protein